MSTQDSAASTNRANARQSSGNTRKAGNNTRSKGGTRNKHTRDDGVRIIKKYPNRRLYDTAISSYITLDDVRQLVVDCESFQVIESKSNEDITRSILMQIINEQEEAGEKPMFTNDFLQQIIRSYGNCMQDMLSSYFDRTIAVFADQQKRLQENVNTFFDSANSFNNEMMNPVSYFQNVAQKNLTAWKDSWQNLKPNNKS